jgi:hypothetical protein
MTMSPTSLCWTGTAPIWRVKPATCTLLESRLKESERTVFPERLLRLGGLLSTAWPKRRSTRQPQPISGRSPRRTEETHERDGSRRCRR